MVKMVKENLSFVTSHKEEGGEETPTTTLKEAAVDDTDATGGDVSPFASLNETPTQATAVANVETSHVKPTTDKQRKTTSWWKCCVNSTAVVDDTSGKVTETQRRAQEESTSGIMMYRPPPADVAVAKTRN